MMKYHTVLRDGAAVTDLCAVADTFGTRFRGLMLRKCLQPGEALFLQDCPAIHCCFMRFTIDVIYLDADMTVIGTETVPPWHVGGRFKGARHVLETEEGRGTAFPIGAKIEIVGGTGHE